MFPYLWMEKNDELKKSKKTKKGKVW
jgi:hypothetical protein